MPGPEVLHKGDPLREKAHVFGVNEIAYHLIDGVVYYGYAAGSLSSSEGELYVTDTLHQENTARQLGKARALQRSIEKGYVINIKDESLRHVDTSAVRTISLHDARCMHKNRTDLLNKIASARASFDLQGIVLGGVDKAELDKALVEMRGSKPISLETHETALKSIMMSARNISRDAQIKLSADKQGHERIADAIPLIETKITELTLVYDREIGSQNAQLRISEKSEKVEARIASIGYRGAISALEDRKLKEVEGLKKLRDRMLEQLGYALELNRLTHSST